MTGAHDPAPLEPPFEPPFEPSSGPPADRLFGPSGPSGPSGSSASSRPSGPPSGPPFDITVDGRRVPVEPGQTVGAALIAAGIRSWRTTRFAGKPRGLFCGIGVCFDCLVTVDGTPSLRACLVTARPGDEVTTT